MIAAVWGTILNPIEYQRLFEAEDSHWWYRSLHRLVLGIVAAEFSRAGHLDMLDAGCGTGRLCQQLAPYGRVYGCDISDLALDFCRKRGVENVRRADLNNADLGREAYDVITSMDVLYHAAVTSEENILKSFYEALKPGGMLLINLPAFPFLMSSHDRAVHTRRRYRRSELMKMLKKSGFTIECCSYRLCAFFPFLAAYRLLRALLDRTTPKEDIPSDVRPVAPALNRLFELVTVLEGRVMKLLPLPFGLSVFAVARKPSHVPSGDAQ